MDCYMRRRGMRTIVYDSFNRANGNLGNADTGQAWLTGGSPSTAWVVSSNLAKRATATNLNSDVAYIDCGKADVTISADVVMTNTYGVYLIARMASASASDSIGAYLDVTGQVMVVKRIAGSSTILGNTTFAYTAGSIVSCVFSCKGNDFKIYINGVLKASVTDDNALKANTRCGMQINLFSSSVEYDYIDNFTVKG